MGIFGALLTLFRASLLRRASLVAENLALRQQLYILQRSGKRAGLHRRDRIFWVWLSRLWRPWHSALVNSVRPHQSLDRNAPEPRRVEPPEIGKVVAIPHVGGLHHRYTRAA